MYHRKRPTKYLGGDQFPPTSYDNITFGGFGPPPPPPPMWHYFYNQPMISSFQQQHQQNYAPPPPPHQQQQPAMNRVGPVYINDPRIPLTSREEPKPNNDFEKKKRNAEAAARHREKKKLTDQRLLQRYNVLLKRQKELQTEVLEKQYQLSRLKLAFFRDRERAECFTRASHPSSSTTTTTLRSTTTTIII